jgi:hypothetical protein
MLRRLRRGELLALLGAVLVLVSLFVACYDSPAGTLSAWDTFGAAVALLLAAACAALALVLSALTERTTALPVSSAVWCVPLGLAGVIAAVVRLLERPEGATGVARADRRARDPRRRVGDAARRTQLAVRADAPARAPAPVAVTGSGGAYNARTVTGPARRTP